MATAACVMCSVADFAYLEFAVHASRQPRQGMERVQQSGEAVAQLTAT